MSNDYAQHIKLEATAASLGDRIHPSIRRYLNFKPLCTQLPHKARFGYELTEVSGFCKECDRPTTLLRGSVREWPRCLEVEGGGLCHDCNKVTYFWLRRYSDGRSMHLTCQGWKLIVQESGIITKAWSNLWPLAKRSIAWLKAQIDRQS